MEKETHKDSGLKYFLTMPQVFLYFQKLIGINRYYENLLKDFIPLKNNMTVLDIGCGCAYFREFLPYDILYVGFDLNEEYIKYARKKYKKNTQFFYNRVSDFKFQNDQLFDLVVSINVVHHLNDSEAETLYKSGFERLKPGGTMIVSDASYYSKQSFFSRILCKMDRGKNIRTPEEYEKLARKFFKNVKSVIRFDMNYLPQITTVVKSIKE